jgi:hypothetical protein
MRLLPQHVERLYREARDGTPVEIIYEPVKLARDAVGSVYLEVHIDVLRGRRHELPAVIDFIEAAGLTEETDVTKVAEAVGRAWGIPVDVTRHPLPEGGPGGVAPTALLEERDPRLLGSRDGREGVPSPSRATAVPRLAGPARHMRYTRRMAIDEDSAIS